MKTVAELDELLGAKRKQLQDIFAKGLDKLTEADVSDIRQRNAELTDISKELDTARDTAAIYEQNQKALETEVKSKRLPTPQSRQDDAPKYKSFRATLSESQGLSAFRAGQVKSTQFELSDETLAREFGMKTLFTSADWDVPAQRLPNFVESVQLPITVSDLMLQGNADSGALTYVEETTFTNNAVETAEGGTKPESALDTTLRTDNIRKIPTWIPLTDEALEDIPQLESYIRGRLAFMVTQRRESQLLNGSGLAPNILGILNRTGIQTYARVTGTNPEPVPDAVYRGMAKVRITGGAEPTAALFHPNDWTDVRLLRTADGVYIWGNPSEDAPERIWGLAVRQTTALVENTALVGAFRPFAQFFRRSGLTIEISRDHSTYRVENKVLLLAEERVGLAVFRPAAFCTITGV